MKTISEIREDLREAAEDIVKSGQEIRGRIARLAARATVESRAGAAGLLEIVRAVSDGAARGAREAAGAAGESRLRAAGEGLADAFRTLAEAAHLTLQESASQGRRFAREDLQRLDAQLLVVAQMFRTAASSFSANVAQEFSQQAGAVGTHAARAWQQCQPALEQTLAALKEDPAGMVKEAASTSAGAARSAAGALFTELGQRLTRLGEKLGPPPSP